MPVTRSNQRTRLSSANEDPHSESSRASQLIPTGCQRCFLRLEKYPDHVCETRQGYRSCRYCLKVRHKCKPIPEEVYPAAVAAMEKTGEERAKAVGAVRQMIRQQTGRLRNEASARDEQLNRELQNTFRFLIEKPGLYQ